LNSDAPTCPALASGLRLALLKVELDPRDARAACNADAGVVKAYAPDRAAVEAVDCARRELQARATEAHAASERAHLRRFIGDSLRPRATRAGRADPRRRDAFTGDAAARTRARWRRARCREHGDEGCRCDRC